MALVVVALTATVLALYVQLFGLRARQAEAREAAARLDDALAESRTRLKAEILAELHADLAQSEEETASGQQPLPDAVFRLEEGEERAGAFAQVVDPARPGESLVRMALGVRTLAKQMEESDRALRRNLEELRIETRDQWDAARRAAGLTLIVLVLLVIDLVSSSFRREKNEG